MSSPETLCSVVMPLYNKAPYVAMAVASVLAQTHANLELIVVDDGSSDDGPEQVRAIADPRVRLEAQANAGVSAARNHAIALARGEWVFFLDGDDWHHPQYLARQMATAARHPDVEVIATTYRHVPTAQFIGLAWDLPAEGRIERVVDLPTRWRAGNCFITGSVGVRRRLLDRMQPCFPPGESHGEDMDLWFRLNEHSAVALLDLPLLAYRVEAVGSLAAVHARSIDLPPFLTRMEARALGGQAPAHLRASMLRYVNESRVTMARMAISQGRRRDAVQLLADAWRSAQGRRWWMTSVMALAWPADTVERWETRRQRRTMNF
ncbi:MAG TPA: glycosyltransferase family A protein [Burkholderiaceae bacterium]|jgi:glycosyltransferase involved in cell wall biosynthesis